MVYINPRLAREICVIFLGTFHDEWDWYTVQRTHGKPMKNGLNLKSNMTVRRFVAICISLWDSAEFTRCWTRGEANQWQWQNKSTRKEVGELGTSQYCQKWFKKNSILFPIICIKRLKNVFEYFCLFVGVYLLCFHKKILNSKTLRNITIYLPNSGDKVPSSPTVPIWSFI